MLVLLFYFYLADDRQDCSLNMEYTNARYYWAANPYTGRDGGPVMVSRFLWGSVVFLQHIFEVFYILDGTIFNIRNGIVILFNYKQFSL